MPDNFWAPHTGPEGDPQKAIKIKKRGVKAAPDARVIYAPYKEDGNISVALGRVLNLKLKNSRSLLIKAINMVATVRIIFYGTPPRGGGFFKLGRAH